jgi:bacterioferritin
MNKQKAEANTQLLELLNKTLELEYSLIIHYPHIAEAIRDVETRQLAQSLGAASIGHFDKVSGAIKKLGGVPRWSFEAFPQKLELKKVFQIQLGKEQLALKLHRQIAAMTTDPSLSEKFNRLSKEEELHIQTVEKILTRLG